MTTEEFIQKAKAVHGNKYDYSKAEYVGNKEKICIICPDHGEFWQTPYKHLHGQGCSRCRYVSISKRFSQGKEIFIEKASIVHKGFYDYSEVEYVNSHTHVKIICPLHGVFTQEPASHLSGCGCPMCAHVKTGKRSRKWTKELCEEEAKRYTSKYDFYNESKNAYEAAVKYGWLDEFTWLDVLRLPNGYWTKERCEAESKKYSSKIEFKKGNPAAHAAASRQGWLDDFVWLIDKRVDINNDKIDSVYVYIFEDTKAAYVGRTLIRRQKKRDKEHIFNQDSDNVARYAKKIHVPVPPMMILETNLTLKEGLEKEDYWRKWYESHGYMMLNKSATGIGKGSLGAISSGKWSRKKCYEEALKYNSSREFEQANGSAYAAALRNGWLKDYTWFLIYWERKWDKETCYAEAQKYSTRGDFQKGNSSAYTVALTNGWIEEYDWMSSRKQKPQGYWDSYDNCYEEAKKYKNRKSFENNCKGGYFKAYMNGWLDDYTWFEEKQKHNYWNKETCYKEAKKYNTATEFARNAVRAYELSRTNGWDKEYTWFVKPFRWTKELCEEEARKYKKRSIFKKNCPAAYTQARQNGWLEEYIWFAEKPRVNYWNKETCYDEAKKYRTRSDFQKGTTGAYQKAWKEGWIDDYIWMSKKRIWTYEACKQEASKYNRRTEFKHALPGAYKKAREQGWLDDFFPTM